MELEEELKIIENAKTNIQEFAKLYDLYFDRIFHYCLNRLGNKEMTEDVCSQIFLLAVENISDFDVSRRLRFGCWLYKIAHNQVIDCYRKNSKKLFFDFENDNSPSTNASPEEEVEKFYLQRQVAFVLSKLHESYQEIIGLRFYSELDNSEIAEYLKINSDRVAVTLHRALKSFRENYQKSFPKSEIFDSF